MPDAQATDQVNPKAASLALEVGQRRSIALFSIDHGDEHFPGVLLRTEPGLYVVRIVEPLSSARWLVMVDGPYRFEVEVLSCKPNSDGGFTIGCRVLACREGIIRQEWRMPVDQAARLHVLAESQTYDCRIRDQSPFGMGIAIDQPLPVALEVSLSTSDGFAYGEIRYCRPRPEGGYFIGILLREYQQKENSMSLRLARFLFRTLAQLIALAGFRRT